MIRNNLSVLLAEHGLKITQVSKATGISRTTLTALSSNRSAGMQLETINTLCRYLKIRPDQLISYIPIEITLSQTKEEHAISSDSETGTTNYKETLVLESSFSWGDQPERSLLYADVTATLRSHLTEGNFLSVTLTLTMPREAKEARGNAILQESFSMLPRPFLSELEADIARSHPAISVPLKELTRQWEGELKFQYIIHWPAELIQPQYKEYRKLTEEEMASIYPKNRRLFTSGPEGVEWF